MAIENIPAGKAVGAWNVNSPRNTSKNEGAEKLGWISFQNVIFQDVTSLCESHDQAITGLINTIRELMKPPKTKKRPIGFVTPQENK